jgi:DNA-binding helix-hairpin-helix protein with protein kinase domain
VNQLTTEKTVDVGADLKRRANLVVANVKLLVVKNDDDLTKADKLVSEWHSLSKGIKEYWKPIKSNAKSILDDAKGKESQMLDPIAEGSKAVVEKMAAYIKDRDEILQAEIDKKKQEEKDAAELAAFEMAEEGLPDEAIKSMEELAVNPAPVQLAHKTIKTKTTIKDDWDVEVVNGQEAQIPHEHLIPANEAMRKAVAANIKKLVVAKSGNIEIAGIRITKKVGSIKRASK